MEICGLNNEENKAIEMLRNYDNEDNLHKIHQSINVVLNLIDKQSKEIEELERNRKVSQNFAKIVATDYISKDKIKAKIEEYEDYGTSIYYGLRSNGKAFQQAVRMEVKEILQSLLEKE